ncbi:UNVERIFIED_CONTAM: Retrovirus-related Pol polyprotein from transposon TNT 1-94 [Sesamum calycinum]|uniref:Retrovirus-related Pol polyprotein from transposon TNT 1-94 n=1 Tax=Sesamum calycinum TaxID=2727403 RepID=A0AAW2RUR6_9LAMI
MALDILLAWANLQVYFVGHAPGRKRYKVFDLDDNVMLISRDVFFHEQIFSFRDLRNVGGSIPASDPLTEEPSISALVSIPIVSSSPRSADCSSPVLPYTTTYDHGSVSTSTDPSSNMLVSSPLPVDSSSTIHNIRSPHLPLATHAKPSHYAFVVSLSNLQEPKTYVEANATEEWRLALRTRVEPYLESGSFASWKICYCLPLGYVCKLNGSLYGLKQASRQWNQEFTSKIASFGFVQSKHDYCLFTKGYGYDFWTLVRAKYFLGVEIARSSQGIIVIRAKYTNDIVSDIRMQYARPTTTPVPPGIKFSQDAGSRLSSPELYRRLVGHLLYLKFTRPNISHATKQLSQFLQFPYQQHWDAATHLVWYLNGSINKGLFFSATSPLTLKAYFDADWACCVDSHRSLTGYGIFLGHSLISWKTKKQNMVSRLTAEAKYRSMGTFVYKLS